MDKGRANRFLARMESMPRRNQVVSYSTRFLAFIDILGFRAVMTEIAATSPNDLFHDIVDSYWFNSTNESVDFQLLSDSIILVSKLDEPSSFISIANAANDIRNSFLNRGFLVRGAIAHGSHFQSHGICISPVLVEAFELESQSAIYPRFICAPSALNRVMPHVQKNSNGRLGIIGPHGFHVIRDQLPIPDFDGQQVIEFLPDTLEPYFLRTGHHHDPSYSPNEDQLKHIQDVGPKVLRSWRTGLHIAQHRCKSSKHHQKFAYLAGKWNQYIASFKGLSREEKEGLLVPLQ